MSGTSTTNFSRVKISSLKQAKFNPTNRLEGRRIKDLARSIQEVGLVYPIAVNQDNEVIDGHRRIAAAKELGWDEVPIIIVSGDRQAIFSEVNATSQKMTAGDNLKIYLVDPLALRPPIRRKHEEAEQFLGRTMMKALAKRGSSINLLRWAKEVANYCERTNDEKFIRRAVKWFYVHRQTRLLRSAIYGGAPASVIERAIKTGKPLTPKYVVAGRRTTNV